MKKEKIVIVGFGWGTIGFLKKIDTEKYNVIILSKNENFLYTPSLAKDVYKDQNVLINISEIGNYKEISFTTDEVSDVNFSNNLVFSNNNNSTNYNYLILSHGSEINTFNIPGIKEECYFLKSEKDSKIIKKKLNKMTKNSRIAVIGCGVTGTEVIGSLIDYDKFKITAIDGLSRPVPIFEQNLSQKVLNHWNSYGVNHMFNTFVSKIDNEKITFKGIDQELQYDLAIWCGGIKMSSLTEKIIKKLNMNSNKGILVNDNLKVNNVDNVFAIGDCADSSYPPTAQVAYQQGIYLANQFNNDWKNRVPFHFTNKGQICYIGKKKSIYQNKYFKTGGTITYYFNNLLNAYYLFTLKK